MTGKIQKILEERGCTKQEKTNLEPRKIKEKIMEMLKIAKKEKYCNIPDLNIVLTHLSVIDHHDCVRMDQILTIMANNQESEYQWASICMNKKFKII